MHQDPNDYQTTTGDVAAIMHVSEAAVRQWCADGVIPALRAGPRKRWRVRNDWQDIFKARLEDQRTPAKRGELVQEPPQRVREFVQAGQDPDPVHMLTLLR